MELHLVITVLCHLILSLIADAKNLAGHVHLGDHGLNSSVPFNVTINGTLVPPYHRNTNGTLLPGYHRNITAGAAWVVPASPFDLGARSMTCECFDPDGKSLKNEQRLSINCSSPLDLKSGYD